MATNPLFTAAFDLASGDDDYGAFLSGIRDRLGNPRHVSHGRPVLPPVDPGAPRWFHVLLRTPASALTLATRADNLRLAGFQSADGTCWELSGSTTGTSSTFLRRRRRRSLIPGATSLGFAATFGDLVGGTREVADVALGRRQMTEAVDALAAIASGGAKDAEQQRPQQRLAKDALAVLLLMVHEATRFLDVAAVVSYLMRPNAAATSGRITPMSSTSPESPDLWWSYRSSLLLSADSHPSMPAASWDQVGWDICEPTEHEHLDKECVETAVSTVGILLFVEVGNGIKADKALRLFRGNLCGTGRDGAGPDVTFLVSGESVAAHRYVLAGKSAVFLRQFIGRKVEKPSSHIEVKDMDSVSFKAMIHFIYTDTVPELDKRRPPEAEEAVAVMAHHLIAAAHRYELDRLKLICERKLQSSAISIDMAARTLALAEQHNYQWLRTKCIGFIIGSPEILHAVLATEGYKHLEASCPSVLTELFKSVYGPGERNHKPCKSLPKI